MQLCLYCERFLSFRFDFDLIYSIVHCWKFVLWFNAPRSSHVRRLMARIVTLWLSLSQGPVNSTSSASSACESTPRSLYFCFVFVYLLGRITYQFCPGGALSGYSFRFSTTKGSLTCATCTRDLRVYRPSPIGLGTDPACQPGI